MSSHLQLSYIAVSSFLPCHEPWTRGNDLVMAWDRILIGFRNLDNTTWTMIDACIQKLILCRKSTSYDTTGKYTHGTTSWWQSFVVIFELQLRAANQDWTWQVWNYCKLVSLHLADVHTFIGAMRRGYHVGWSIQHPIIHMDFKVRGWQVSLVLLVLHNSLVSVLRDMHRH